MNHHFAGAVLRIVLAVSSMVCLSASQSSNTSHSGSGSASLPQGTTLVAELAKPIDAGKARTGDTVKAKIVQDVIASGQILMPRGTVLFGHVTNSKVSSAGEPQSVLGMVFDRVALKHGPELSLKAVLQALAPPPPEPDPLGSSSYDGSNRAGQQPLSGRDPGWIAQSRHDHSRNDALVKAADPNSYGHSADTPHNGLLGNGNHGVFGMPGVTLKSGPDVAEPELISTTSDIKLERGTQIVLAVRVSPGAGSNHL